MKQKKKIVKNVIDELLLYSGQFGLFYIIMQLIIERGSFFYNTGHVGLSISLAVQAFLLSLWGEKAIFRFSFSFIVPVVYSILEYSEGSAYLLNTAHIGFWIYALISSSLMIIKIGGGEKQRRFTEIALVVVNIFIFLFLYFYFDTWKEVQDNSKLTILQIFSYLGSFLADPTHWYIIIGGVFLAVTIAMERYEIAWLKDKIASLFGKYVDSNIRDTIIAQGEFHAKKEKLCILFSDIESFTSLCERNEAGSIAQMLNTYFEYWNSIVKKHNGTIDKYIGDAIMVIFGLEKTGHPCDLAVRCALEAYGNRHVLIEELNKAGLPIPEGFGIGCHYGELIIGDIGSKDRKNFTVVGDTVNIASRLESVTRKVGNKIVVSDAVYDNLSIGDRKHFISIGETELKGKSGTMKIWGNLGNLT